MVKHLREMVTISPDVVKHLAASRACSRVERNAALQIKVGQNRNRGMRPTPGRLLLRRGDRTRFRPRCSRRSAPGAGPESGRGGDHLRSDLGSVGKKLGSVGTDLGSLTHPPGFTTRVTACDELRDAFRD